jgi:glycosyltransferase involved in cell wall biosynthesis
MQPQKTIAILHIIDSLCDYGGAQTLLLDLCLQSRNGNSPLMHSVCVLHGTDKGVFYRRLVSAGVPVMFLAPSRLALVTIVIRLFLRLMRHDFAILHLHLRCSSFVACFYRVFKKVPVLVTIYEARNQLPLSFDLIYPVIAPFIDGFITTFPSTINRLKARGISGDRIHFIQQTVDISNIAENHEACRTALCRQYGFDKRRPLLLSVARFNKDRRIITLIEAMRSIVVKYPDCLLLMVGDGPEYLHLTRRCREVRLEANVIFTGLRSDDWNLFPGCDIYLTCSDDWMPGIAALKAMACSRCVVAYNLNRMELQSEMVDKAGAFIVTRDSAAMASEVIQLIGTADERNRMGNRARRIIIERLGVPEYVRAHERLYATLVD